MSVATEWPSADLESEIAGGNGQLARAADIFYRSSARGGTCAPCGNEVCVPGELYGRGAHDQEGAVRQPGTERRRAHTPFIPVIGFSRQRGAVATVLLRA
jgi:hypothetical protein